MKQVILSELELVESYLIWHVIWWVRASSFTKLYLSCDCNLYDFQI